MTRVLACAALLVLFGAGCGESPRQGFEAFYGALARGDDDAFLRLSTRAQATFAGAARAQGFEPKKYLTSAYPKSTVRTIDVVDEKADHATLSVKDALGNEQRVAMVRENGRWLVDLSP